MKVLGIVPARAGSKGLTNKNVRLLMGKPVIGYTIEAALAAKRLDAVAVTTDDLEAQEIARGYGVNVIDRPVELAGDAARIDDVMRHCCRQMEQTCGWRADVLVLLYANVPIRAEGIIDRAVGHLETEGGDSVQTVAPVGKFHPFWLYKLDGDRATKYVPNSVHRRQDLPAVYYIDGAVAVVRRKWLMAAEHGENPHAFLGDDRRAIVQKAFETVDIDRLSDLYAAEGTMRERQESLEGV